jgi:hypothetical protein
MSAPFRHALSERGLQWAVGIPRHQKVYPGDVALIFPVAGRGRPRQRHIPDSRSISAQAVLAGASWRSVSWRRGMIAYAFLQHRRLASARREKKNQRGTTTAKPASGTSCHPRSQHALAASAMSALSEMAQLSVAL